MTSLQDMLPDADSSVLCSDFSRNIGLDPAGSAIRADRVVLIETPAPWPKPVFDHELLAEAKPVFDRSATTTRVLASVPVHALEDGQVAVDVFDRNSSSVDGSTTSPTVDHYRFAVGVNDLFGFAQAFARHPIGETLSPQLSEQLLDQGVVDSPILIVCTQGSHDICCGSKGTRFAADAEVIDDLTVYRVSHTGGHRFAPTAMTLPDGRMWADLTVEKLQRIVARTDEVDDVVGDCRGWWGADRGAAQVAERAVFSLAGWDLDTVDRSVNAVSEAGDDSTAAQRWLVQAGEDRWEVVVSVARQVPTIACHSPGGLPAKPSNEFQVCSIQQIKNGRFLR